MNRVLAAAARSVSLGAALGAALLSPTSSALAQTLLDPALTVTTVASGLSQPIAKASRAAVARRASVVRAHEPLDCGNGMLDIMP